MNRFALRKSFGVVLGCFVLMACGDASTDSSANPDSKGRQTQKVNPMDAVDRYNAEQSAASTTFCDCYTESVYEGDRGSCEEIMDFSIEPDACEEAAANCAPESYIAYFDCFSDAHTTFNACLSTCPDRTNLATCRDALQQKMSTCAALQTAALIDALGECQAGRTPSCAAATDPTADPSGADADLIELFVGNYWKSSFDTSWLISTFAWNQMEIDSGSSTRHSWVLPRSDGTYTYVHWFPCFNCTPIYTNESGTWEIRDGKITISDDCDRIYTHPIHREGDRIIIGELEWKSDSQNNFEIMLNLSDETCRSTLSQENPQRQN